MRRIFDVLSNCSQEAYSEKASQRKHAFLVQPSSNYMKVWRLAGRRSHYSQAACFENVRKRSYAFAVQPGKHSQQIGEF